MSGGVRRDRGWGDAVPEKEQERPGGLVQSVQRSARVLRALSEHPGWATAAQVAERTGLSRTLTYRLLCTLHAEGLARRAGSRFALGEENLRLGYSYLEGLGFYRSTLAYAVVLSTRFARDKPWVVSLGVPVRDEVWLVDRHWSSKAPLELTLDIGVRLPIARSAIGRAILAGYREADARGLVGDDDYEAVAERLEQTRTSGVSLSAEEVRAGVYVLAAPIRTPGGAPVAAISVAGTDLREELSPDSEVARHVCQTAEDLGRELAARS